MVSEKEGIIKFAEEFFKNLKAEYIWENETLVVNKVSKDFETFSGKKSPYYLVFDAEKEGDNTELLTKGSYFLKAMASYLDNSGQTTLLKIDFNYDVREELSKYLNFKNCSITNVTKKEDHKNFLRFTFLTTFSFLNEREQIMNSIFVEEGKIIDFDLSKYQTIEGKKQDVELGDVKQEYNLAREKLKEILQPKIGEVGEDLNKRLEKEIERIKSHYASQLNEGGDELKKHLEEIQELEKERETALEEDKIKIDIKLKKLKENIAVLKDEKRKEELRKEEQFFISDEIHKHSLNIDNKLMNTSIVYYPIFNYTLTLGGREGRRMLDLKYHPITKELSKIKCESCKKEIKDIILCGSGHVICRDCVSICGECGKEYCKDCVSKTCSLCGKKLCRKCISKCSSCGKYYCKSHIGKSLGKELCSNCIRKCSSCGKSVEKSSIKRCSCGRELCEQCFAHETVRVEGKIACKNCSRSCSICGKVYGNSSFSRCSGCKNDSCNFPGKCLSCRKKLCPKLKNKV